MNLHGAKKTGWTFALYFYFSEKNGSALLACSCPVPCTKTRFEPSLSYALLSRKNIKRLVIDSRQKKRQLQVQHFILVHLTACKRSLGQGNIFKPAYYSVHGGSGGWILNMNRQSHDRRVGFPACITDRGGGLHPGVGSSASRRSESGGR